MNRSFILCEGYHDRAFWRGWLRERHGLLGPSDGTKVVDPFRPLEDPDAPATRAWIEAENRETSAFLDAISQRAGIKKRLTELWNFEKYAPPVREGGRFFFTYKIAGFLVPDGNGAFGDGFAD